MRCAYPVSTVRSAEQALMARLPDGALMQRAAAGLAATCARLLSGPSGSFGSQGARRALASDQPRGVYGARVVLLLGSGDNGGDALYAGTRLARRGAVVHAIAAGSRVHEAGCAALKAAGGRIVGAADAAVPGLISQADLIIDGMLGIGGRGGLREPYASLADQAAAAAATVVAVDLPSGIDAGTGIVEGPTVQADVTVTFGTYKPGLLIDPGASFAGAVELVDIGLGPDLAAAAEGGGTAHSGSGGAGHEAGHAAGNEAEHGAVHGAGHEAEHGAVHAAGHEAGPVIALQAWDVAEVLPRPGAESDKYRRGVLGIVAGSSHFSGAAALSVGGAVHGGAGMVRFISSEQVTDVIRQLWPEVVITVAGHFTDNGAGNAAGIAADGDNVAGTAAGNAARAAGDAGNAARAAGDGGNAARAAGDGGNGARAAGDGGNGAGAAGDGADAARQTLQAAGRVQAWTAGPGMGTGEDSKRLLAAVLETDLPVLVDADGLTIVAEDRSLLRRDAPTLITPHAGELARLLRADRVDVEARRLEHVRRAAAELGVTVLLKGSTTVIASPDGPTWVNATGTPWLATAGSGDVLSGLGGALLAQGLEPASAAAVAAYLHGLSARLAAAGSPGAGSAVARAAAGGTGAARSAVTGIAAARSAVTGIAAARSAVAGIAAAGIARRGSIAPRDGAVNASEPGAPIAAGDVIRSLPAAFRAVASAHA